MARPRLYCMQRGKNDTIVVEYLYLRRDYGLQFLVSPSPLPD